MFHQSEIQHHNMILNVISNFIAFILGFAATITSTYNTFSHSSTFLTIPTPSDTFSFLLKSIIAGFISLLVKVLGDLIIHYYKERKAKNGKH